VTKLKKTEHPFRRKGIIADIEEWNLMFPFDYVWRKKYKIPFGSIEHRSMSLFDIRYDILEERYIRNISIDKRNIETNKNKLLKRMKVQEVEEISDEEFDNLDLSKYNDIVVK
jgi:hypothetical protein